MADQISCQKTKNPDGTYSTSGTTAFSIASAQTIEWIANYLDSAPAGNDFYIHRSGQPLNDICFNSNLSGGLNTGTYYLTPGNYEISIAYYLMGAGNYTIKFNRVASISGSPAAYSFGTILENDTAPEKTFTIESTGDVPVTISNVVASDPAHFQVLQIPTSQTVPPNKSFKVQCNTSDPGVHGATITIYGTSDLGNVTATISVNSIIEAQVASAGISPLTYNFGTVLEGSLEPTKTFSISSTGNTPFTIDSVTSGNPVQFEIQNQPVGQQVPPNRTFIVKCKTNTPGVYNNVPVNVNGHSSIGPISQVSANVSCIIEAKEPNIACVGPINLGSADWSIGEEKIFTKSFENNGTDVLNITEIKVINDSLASVFTLEGTPSLTPLPAGGTRDVSIRFAPLMSGSEATYQGHLEISSDDPDEPTKNCYFTAIAHHPVPIIRIESTLLDFGKVELGFSFTKAMIIHNDGDAPLIVSVSNVDPTDSDLDHFTLEEGTVTINPNTDPAVFKQIYSPQAASPPTHVIILEASSNDPAAPSTTVTLKGEGIAPIPLDCVLVLDRSGSMAEPAGARRKIDALQSAADLFVHLLRPEVTGSNTGDKIGFVKYNDQNSIYLNMDYVDRDINNPDQPGPHLSSAESKLSDSAIADLNLLAPTRRTGIGGAMQTGANMLVNSPVDRKHVMAVLTDGKENEQPWINQVIGPITNADPELKIYSIGLGSDVDPAKLQAIAQIGNGYHQVVDGLEGTSLFDLESFYFKIFCNANAMSLVVDPTQLILLTDTAPVIVNRARISSSDRNVTFLVVEEPKLKKCYNLELVAPNGQVIIPGSHFGGIPIHVLHRYNYTIYKIIFPESTVSYAGEWILRLTPILIKKENSRILVSDNSEGIAEIVQARNLIPICFAAAVKSNFRLNTETLAVNYLPGEEVLITASLTDCGWPVNKGNVAVTITAPNGEQQDLKLFDDGTHGDLVAGDGVWSSRYNKTSQQGTYKLNFRASGENDKGEVVFREDTRYLTLQKPEEPPEDIKKPCLPCWLQKLLWASSITLLLIIIYLLLGGNS